MYNRKSCKLLKSVLLAILVVASVLVAVGCSTKKVVDGDGSVAPVASKPVIDFQENGGSVVSSVRADVLRTAPLTTRENYVFEGWYRDKTLETPAVFPLVVEYDTTLYAKWLKVYDETGCKDCHIKLSSKTESALLYNVTPSGFDIDRLEDLGYKIRITVTYDVFYIKDYDVLWDIGYMGSPKYEAYLVNSRGFGDIKEDQSTKKSETTRTLQYSARAGDFLTDRLTLKFSTDNIQNLIYFENIKVVYECYK